MNTWSELTEAEQDPLTQVKHDEELNRVYETMTLRELRLSDPQQHQRLIEARQRAGYRKLGL